MKVYDEMSYWTKRKNPTSGDGEAQVSYLKKRVRGAERILDFGPGIGRTMAAYDGAEFVCTVDISTTYRDRLMKEALKYDFKFASYYLLRVEDAKRLPFVTGSYDFAVACQVLMHMKPHYIEDVLVELVRIANEVVVITLMHTERDYDHKGSAFPQDRYCFNYDVVEMCDRLGLQTRNVEYANKNVMLVCSRKEEA